MVGDKEIITSNHTAEPEPLSKKVIKGSFWVFSLAIVNRGLSFLRLIVLARLLVPADFGFLEIAMLSIATLESITQTGFQAALIQKKGNIEKYLDTVWTVSAIRGAVLFCILFFSAPVIAGFFHSPEAISVIKVIAISTVLAGFRNIGILFFQKDLKFHKRFFFEFSATVVDFTVAISLAFVLRNYWALIWGGIAANFIRLLMSYIIHPYRPKLRLRGHEFKELFEFGKWIFGSSIVALIVTQGDDIFVGKMMGVAALGLYKMAYLISNMQATEISHVISQVTYPAYSKLQDHPDRLKQAYSKIVQVTLTLSIPISIAIVLLADRFTSLFLGSKWLAVAPLMKLLALTGLLRSIAATAGPLFQGVGKPALDLKMNLWRMAVMLLTIYPFSVYYGINGVCLSVLLSVATTIPIWVTASMKYAHLSLKDLMKILNYPLIGSGLIATTIWLFANMIDKFEMQGFIFLILMITLTYGGFLYKMLKGSV